MEKQNNEALKAINRLVETCAESEKSFRIAAKKIDNPEIKSELKRFAEQRAKFRNELTICLSKFGESPKDNFPSENDIKETEKSSYGAWINLKSSLFSHSNKAILDACEKSDAATLKTYESVMKGSELPTKLQNMIRKQHDKIEETKTAVSTLKNTIM